MVRFYRLSLVVFVLVLVAMLTTGCGMSSLTPQGDLIAEEMLEHTLEPVISVDESTPSDATPEPNTQTPEPLTRTLEFAGEVPQPSQTPTPITQNTYAPAPAPTAKTISRVSVFLNASQSMMGYVDLPEKNVYLNALETIHSTASVAFPQAGIKAARSSLMQDIPEWLDSKQAFEQLAAQPSFYLVQDLIFEPSWVRLLGTSAKSEGARMNEFTDSYYTVNGIILEENVMESSMPTIQAANWILNDTADLTIILTDLQELQNSRGLLAETIQRAANQYDYAFGIIAQDSSFSGLVPVQEGGDTVWYEWGAMPTGSTKKVYDYGFLTLGESIDPESRQTADRPFYLICIGDSAAVSRFVNRYQQDVVAANAQANLDTYILDHRYISSQALTTKVQDSGFTSGIYQYPGSGKDGTLNNFQMTNPLKGDKDRSVTVTFYYSPKDSDPRLKYGSFDNSAFDIKASVWNTQTNENRQTDSSNIVISSKQVQMNVDGTVTIQVVMAHPYSSVPTGQFRVDISVDIQPPTVSELPDWIVMRNTDVLWQNQGRAFDGSKTVGLSAFMESLQAYYRDKLEPIHLGDASYVVSVQ